MAKKPTRANFQWCTIDMHIHTPASSDFQQPDVTMLDILQRAENRGLDIVAITDHNTVAGFRKLTEEIEQLELLEKLNRLMPEERAKLAEYRRLMTKMLVLPGVEFTATFGFHILGIFDPKKPVREIEHLLLSLNIPPALLDEGSATVGATTDVLTAYRVIRQAGGLVIAAHANSSNGVAMRGFNFGGQTKIAYTQDSNLHALEVTDLDLTGPRSTGTFFSGTKPEYPRRMHCLQGSDCHRLTADPLRKKNLGVGDRATELLLPELSFDALVELLDGNDFSRTRPRRLREEPAYDFIQTALEEGPNLIQDFHESMTIRGGKLYAVIADICAFANTNGGTLYIGLAGDPHKPPVGVSEAELGIQQLEKEINNRISPPLRFTIDNQDHKGKKIVRVLVQRGDDPPYAVDDNKIYVRDEAETGLAVRDEIVSLVLRSQQSQPVAVKPSTPATKEPVVELPPVESIPAVPASVMDDVAPRTGVEVLSPVERQGGKYFTMRDLRNGNVVKNVTKGSARRLWHYAITRFLEIEPVLDNLKVQWEGDYGLVRRYKQGKSNHYDMIQRTPDGGFRYYFGVTEDGIHGPWKNFTGEDEV